MRNLFLGYFHTPRNKRAEVLRLMGNVVGLERDDVDKVSARPLLFLLSILSFPSALRPAILSLVCFLFFFKPAYFLLHLSYLFIYFDNQKVCFLDFKAYFAQF